LPGNATLVPAARKPDFGDGGPLLAPSGLQHPAGSIWFNSTLVQQHLGSTAPWFNSTLVQQHLGSTAPWFNSTLVQPDLLSPH
jgi:hypothetical protein